MTFFSTYVDHDAVGFFFLDDFEDDLGADGEEVDLWVCVCLCVCVCEWVDV